LNARRAALLGVIAGEHQAFARNAINVRRAVAHQAERVGADVGLADIVAENDEDVRLLARRRRRLRLRLRRLHPASRGNRGRCSEAATGQQDIAAVDGSSFYV